MPRAGHRARRSTSSCSTSGCPGMDGLATLARLRERQIDSPGRDDLRARQHRVGRRARSRWARSTSSRSRCRSRRRCSSSATRCASATSRPRTGPCGPGRSRQQTMVGESLMHAAAARAGRDGRADQRARADFRRERHRQGARRAHRARLEPPAQSAIRRGQLRGHPRGADRKRAVRPREGRVHRRSRRSERALRGGATAGRSSSTRSAT